MSESFNYPTEQESEVQLSEEELSRAYISEEKIQNGTITLHCTCMDDRVPDTENGLKIGTAGGGILMTNLDAPEFKTNDKESIYAFLSSPASGDSNFRTMIASVKQKLGPRGKALVSDHADCGAAGIFCEMFQAKHGTKLDPPRVAKAAAKRLHTALGLSGEPSHADYTNADIAMSSNLNTYETHSILIDATSRFRSDAIAKEKLCPFKLSGLSLLKDENDEGQNAYLATELEKGSAIAAGRYGVRIEDVHIFIICDKSSPSRETILRRYNLHDDGMRKIHWIQERK